MDAADQWTTHQGIGVVKDSEITRTLQLQGDNINNNNKRGAIRPNYKEQPLNCPRCNSSNTKFCYYNNYSLSQPRYFCKTCRRYWTDGGSLRNVPVGGGSRKNKRPSSSSSASSSAAAQTTFPSSSSLNINPSNQLIPPIIPHINPTSKFYDQGGQDLNLCFRSQNLAHYGFPPASESCLGTGFGFQELMRHSNMKLPLGDVHGGYGNAGTMQDAGTGRLLFPFEDLRQVQMSNGNEDQQINGGVVQHGTHDPSLFW